MRRTRRGQTLVEFALILPVFILLLVGLFDTARLIYAYNTVNNAAREGGRQAIVDQVEAHIQDRAAEKAVALGIGAANVSVDYRTTDDAETPGSCAAVLGTDAIYGCLAVVIVPYDFVPATPIIGNLIGTIHIEGEARFPVEFNCLEPAKPQCPVGQ